ALPRFRSDIFGHKDHPLNIQLAGDQGLLVSRLRQRGWEEAEMLGWNNILRLLTPRAQLTSLPVPPQVHDARHEELVMVKQLTEQQRLLLRLWPTALRLAPDELEISIGNVTLQKAETVIGMLTIPRTIHQFERPVELLRQELGESGAGIDLATGSVIRLQLRPGSD
ncbi:MAG: LssY C-terminal domain-containing protein, partial [Candidatus Thiodiazotropha sp.]